MAIQGASRTFRDGDARRTAELHLVIPARNEAARIGATVVDCCRSFGARARITVVANDCTDDTADVVRLAMRSFDNLELIETPQAVGKGGAVRLGLARGDEPFVAFVDADGAAGANVVLTLLGRLRGDPGAAGVIGSRWLPASSILKSQSLARRIASRGFNVLVRALFGLPFSDTQCGAKVFRRTAVASVLDTLELTDFAFDVDVLVAMRAGGFRVVEAPIVWRDVSGGSLRLLPAAASMARSVVRLRVLRSPLVGVPFVARAVRGAVPAVVTTRDFNASANTFARMDGTH